MADPDRTPQPTPWHGDYQQRLSAMLAARGFANLNGFLEAHPAIGYVTLASMSGDYQIAAMQLVGEQMRLACADGTLRAAAIDSLVRFLNEYVPRGWRQGKHFSHRSASALAAWSTMLEAHATDRQDIVASAAAVLNELEFAAIPPGWLPRGTDDPFIVSAFDSKWPPG